MKRRKIVQSASLATKISKRLLIIMTMAFIAIAVAILMLANSMITALSVDGCNRLSEKTGAQMHEIVNEAISSSGVALNYMEHNYEKLQQRTYDKGYTSEVFEGVKISDNGGVTEEFLTKLATEVISSRPVIEGMGIFLGDGNLDPAIPKYTFYVSEDEGSESGTMIEQLADEEWESNYYTETMKTGKQFITPPYEEDGKNMLTVCDPIMINGEAKGVIITDVLLDEFNKIKVDSDKYKSLFGILLNEKGEVLYHSSDQKAVGQNLKDRVIDFSGIEKGMRQGKQFKTETKTKEDKRDVEAFFVPIKLGDTIWWTYTGVDKKELSADITRTSITLVIMFVVTLALLVIVASKQIKSNLKPLTQLTKAGEALARGDFSYEIEYKATDEIGQACESVRIAFFKLKAIISDLGECMSALENADLTKNMQVEYPGEFEGVKASYLSLLERLNTMFAGIKNSVTQINMGAEQVSTGAQSLSQSSTEQAASVEELSATIGDIYEKIKLNSENADEANRLAQSIGTDIENSNTYMNSLMISMEKMTDASNEVEKIIKTIDDIAFQTNILALNAAVEAARAGEAGKGFAVVADEVRNLAGKSAEAAKTTTMLIGTAIEAVAEGREIADQTATSLNQVVENANTIINRISEIAQSSEEQATSASQINQGADQISAAVQTNSATSQESAATSEELSGQATVLDGMISKFKLVE